MAQLAKVYARFLRKSDGKPVFGRLYTVKLYDKDIVIDDMLGQSRLSADGGVQFLFDIADVSSADSPLELKPDLYLTLFDGDREIFRSAVRWNLDFLHRDRVTGQQNELTQDLGTFEVECE